VSDPKHEDTRGSVGTPFRQYLHETGNYCGNEACKRCNPDPEHSPEYQRFQRAMGLK
jgi:hypothetical protein